MCRIRQQLLLGECVLLLLVNVCSGLLECLCTTPECQASRDYLCYTEDFCYVQYTPALGGDADPDGGGGGAPEGVVRGCIDGPTPLLCENQRPGFYAGAWPVMHCCRTPLCNKEVLPTPPSWLLEGQVTQTGRYFTSTSPHHDRNVGVLGAVSERPASSHAPREYSRPSVWVVNPLYVGVPLAGACMLVGISVFAVYILRRQKRVFREEYMKALKRHRTVTIPRCQGGCHGVPCPYVAMVTKGGQPPLPRCQAGCFYVDSDVSSSGSESRLLAHV